MSTRSAIFVKGAGHYRDTETVRVYKHMDGYPTANLPLICDALKLAKGIQDKANKRWKTNKKPNASLVAGSIVSASLDEYGLAAQIEEHGSTLNDVLGNQRDIEWVYLVDMDNKQVNVYKGAPNTAFSRGITDPLTYVNQLKADYKARESKAIKKAVSDIKKLGFKFNR